MFSALKGCVLTVELDSFNRPFYVEGDTVSGIVRCQVLRPFVVNEIEIKLRCEEFAAVAVDWNDRQENTAKVIKRLKRKEGIEAPEKKPRAQTEFIRHYSKTVDALKPNEKKTVLEKGEYVYQFQFVVPGNLPPNAPIKTNNGLNVGVRWTIKASVHRKWLLNVVKSHKAVPVNVQSLEYQSELPSSTVQLEMSEMAALRRPNRSLLGIFNGNPDKDLIRTVAITGYPRVGLVQTPLRPSLSLRVECRDTSGVWVRNMKFFIIQKCQATVGSGKWDIYSHKYALGTVQLTQLVSGVVDLTPKLSELKLEELLAPPLSTQHLKIWYELRAEIKLSSDSANKITKLLAMESPVPLLSPVTCWCRGNNVPIPVPGPVSATPSRKVSSFSSQGNSSEPETSFVKQYQNSSDEDGFFGEETDNGITIDETEDYYDDYYDGTESIIPDPPQVQGQRELLATLPSIPEMATRSPTSVEYLVVVSVLAAVVLALLMDALL